MKFKEGDKVLVKKDLIVGNSYGGEWFRKNMGEFIGKIVTIDYVDKSNDLYYVLELEGSIFYRWTDEMFEGLAKDYMIDKIEEFCGEQENCHGCSLKLSDYCNTLKDEITYNQVKEAFDVLNKQEETKISCNIEECNANKNVKQIDILGEKYNIYFDVDPKGKELEGKTLGVCYRSRREIYIANLEQDTDLKNEPAYAKENKLKEIIRHEVIQAFLNESGLKSNSLCCDFSWVENEQMIDWIAIQFPKIVKVFNLLGVIE